jgi:hypothetical protein
MSLAPTATLSARCCCWHILSVLFALYFSLSKQAVPQDASARILREARAQQEELDAEDLQQTTAAAAGPTQIPAGAIAAALQQLHDSDSEGGDGLDGFTEAGSVWGGDDVSGPLCLLFFCGLS